MSEQAIRVPVAKLVDFMIAALLKMGVPPEDAGIIADVLITADLWGVRSHGVAHLKMYHERMKTGLQLPVTRWNVVKETPTTAVIDGGNGMGMVVGTHAMQLAIQKAQKFGLGAVAVRNSSHYGVAGYYPLMAVKAGMVGLSVTNAHPSIAPTFGTEPMLGTNPIAVAAPTDEDFPYMYDAATSVVPRGKIEVAARANKPIPEGWVISKDGSAATDTSQMIAEMNQGDVALLPLGGMGEIDGRAQRLRAGNHGGDLLRRLPERRLSIHAARYRPRRQSAVPAHWALLPGDQRGTFHPAGGIQTHYREHDARAARLTQGHRCSRASILPVKRNTSTRSECKGKAWRLRRACKRI